jgi:RNA 2',3'-cyclic 3'-phosphodiesterase
MAGESKSLRLFVALELPDDVRRALADVQEQLHNAGAPKLRWVRPEGIHLTLKFLGSVEGHRVAGIESALEKTIEPFEVTLQPTGVGGFGGRRIRVLWVGLEGDVGGVTALAAQVDDSLGTLGFERERRPFAAHLTLARVPDEVSGDERSRLDALIKAFEAPAMPSMQVHEVSLMRSILGAGGARYERLASFPRT